MDRHVYRNTGIDLMRFSAIVIMLIANSLPYYQDFNPSIILRLICSLAAPMFVFLSGFSLHLSKTSSQRNRYFPALSVLIAAIFVDVAAWRVIPFVEYDVLYLISAGLLFNVFFQGKGYIQLFSAITILGLGPLALKFVHYRHEMIEFSVGNIPSFFHSFQSLNILKRFLFDGWFPIIPWLGFALLGYYFFYIQEQVKRYRFYLLILSSAILIVSFILLQNIPPMQIRNGYVEVFYPLTYVFILLALSWILLVYCLTCSNSSSSKLLRNISVLGRRSLFVYILHSFVLSYLVDSFLNISNWIHFILFLLVLFLICYAFCRLIEHKSVQMQVRKMPLILIRSLGL